MSKYIDDLVSVIIPVYNAEKFVSYTLDSVINQDYKNIEIIIIDDCSKDNSFDIISKYMALDSRINIEWIVDWWLLKEQIIRYYF